MYTPNHAHLLKVSLHLKPWKPTSPDPLDFASPAAWCSLDTQKEQPGKLPVAPTDKETILTVLVLGQRGRRREQDGVAPDGKKSIIFEGKRDRKRPGGVMEGGKGAAIDDEGGSVGGKEKPLGLKLRRGVAVGKRGGLCTPVPTWKLGDADPTDGNAGEPTRSSVSARKLGANLWEIQEMMPVAAMCQRGNKIRRHGEGKAIGDEHNDQPESAGSLRRHAAAALIKHHTKMNERNALALQPVSPASYSSSMEIAAASQAITPSSFTDLKGKFGKVGYGLKTSTELLKVLNRIWSLEEQHASNVSLVKSLNVELEHARTRMQELMQEQHVYRHEMENLVKRVAEEKAIKKSKEQQRIKAVQLIRKELEDERHLRRRSESLHRKLGKELSEVNAAYMKALQDFERERKTNSLLENLCDEFAKDVTDYEQEVRKLKQKYPSDCDSVVDRLILHISEAWLDERVQLNIAEVQGDWAEKTIVTDRLNNKIELFLQSRRSNAFKNCSVYQKDERKYGNMRRQSLESVLLNGATSAPNDADDEDDDDDSVPSDLNCFELNVSACKRSHPKLKQNNQRGIKEQDSRFGPSESKNSLSVLDEKRGKTKLSRKNIQHPDRVTGVHFPTDDECAGDEEDRLETRRSKKSDYCHSQEAKLKWARVHQSKLLAASSGKNHSEISECCAVAHGETWKSQFALAGADNDPRSIDGDNDPGSIHQISSPVQQWKYQHRSTDVPESSTKSAQDIKESTLKAKLLEARLEGKHARLKTVKHPSLARTRHRE